MKKKSKRYKNILKNIVKDKKLDPKTALDLVKQNQWQVNLFQLK